jgi:hypothetical protein
VYLSGDIFNTQLAASSTFVRKQHHDVTGSLDDHPTTHNNSNNNNASTKAEPTSDHTKSNPSPWSSSTPLNLQTCIPNVLAEYLLQHRFATADESKAVAFLQAAAKAVPKEATVDASSSLPAIDLGDALLEEGLETSLIVPRAGKFQIQFHQHGLLAINFNDPLITLFVPSQSVSHIILFAKPEDIKTICKVAKRKKPKPPNAHLVLLQLSDDVLFQNKEICQVCFALGWNSRNGKRTT